MVTEHFEFAGWTDNLRLANDQVEVVILREAGPRIISLRPLNGFNVFKVVAEESGKSQEETWKIRGGHRLWTAPEDYGDPNSLTYVVDNFPVEYEIKGEFHAQVTHFMQKPAQIRRDISVQLAVGGPKITVEHLLTNQGNSPLRFAPWALSVMAPGGSAVIPQPPLGTHPKDFLPNRSLTLWPFTDLSDDRIRFGQRFIRFQQADRGPIKFGLRHTEKWAGYVLGDHLFLKTIPLIEGKQYPDLGSNFELFTNEEFLELESLGPYEAISPGETAKHTEIWAVFSGIRLPHLYDEEGFAEAIDPYLKQLL
ncbi:MAG TPA: hypothetical protein VN957_15610 [Chthoniobacterales bacterium]|jgi:hypothetical protein|nr:hypothetical protein [Chthoniobacterales bacterium]